MSICNFARRTVKKRNKTQKVLLYSSVNCDIANIAVKLQHNNRLFCYIDYINCTTLEEVQRGFIICREMVLQWH